MSLNRMVRVPSVNSCLRNDCLKKLQNKVMALSPNHRYGNHNGDSWERGGEGEGWLPCLVMVMVVCV